MCERGWCSDAARRQKELQYLELLGDQDRARSVVLASEVGRQMVRGEPGVPQTIGEGQSPQRAAGHTVACKGGVVVAVEHHVGVQRSTFPC